MQTFAEQKAFFEAEWPGLRTAVEGGGADAVVTAIESRDAALERRVLYVFVRQGLVHQHWNGKNLETYIAVARAGIRECLRQAGAEPDPEVARRRTDTANVISYNLAADLADCWEADGQQRTAEHFKAGLAAANDCVRWREELDKPPGPRSMAWWAKGMHELSLGHPTSAASFERSLDYATRATPEDSESFGVVLGEGYLGIAELRGGNAAGQQRYEAALARFRAQLDDDAKRGDAQFGIDQLETVRERYPG